MKFFVKTDNRISGPYSAKQILEMNLMHDTLVKEECINEWLPFSMFDFRNIAAQELILDQHKSSDSNTLTAKANGLKPDDNLPKMRQKFNKQNNLDNKHGNEVPTSTTDSNENAHKPSKTGLIIDKVLVFITAIVVFGWSLYEFLSGEKAFAVGLFIVAGLIIRNNLKKN